MKLRTSDSSRATLHMCEREFELYKLVGPIPVKHDETYHGHGHAFEAGGTEYLLTGNKEMAMFKCWLGYGKADEDDNYSPFHSMLILEAAFGRLDELRDEWEVAFFNGKPAAQLKIRVNVNPDIYDIAIIDVVLRNKKSGMYAILEFKTTSSNKHDINPLYKNKSQTIGYSICLDAVAGQELTSFDTIHFVAQQKGKKMMDLEFHILSYRRDLQDRINWFITLGMDIQHIQQMMELNYFPMRGASCIRFNRPCDHFGFCNNRAGDVPRQEELDDNVYDFEFFLDDIVADHIRRVKDKLVTV